VLLTGAAGRIGTGFWAPVGTRYNFRLADRSLHTLSDVGEHGTMAFDIADPAACHQACAGIDTVVHLAADPSPEAPFYGALLENNIQGTYNILRAAADNGCRRVVYASSAHAVAGYPHDVQVHPNMPVWPVNPYSVSKCFGEALARSLADQDGLSAICVRIGYYEPPPSARPLSWRELSLFVSARDLNQLLVCCIEATAVPFAIVHGLSDNRFKALDISSARQLLGYAPQDDAFVLFGVPPSA
jgi:nucleoside-diphosphate-sugar epimerase